MADDTIFALSSGALPAAIAVMRVSGPAAGAALAALAGSLPAPRRAVRRRLRDADGALLDDALVLWLPGPQTATGEDVAELHLHGGRAVVAAVSAALACLPEMRPAVAGEFTRRALVNCRIDLSQAEGLADLLAAETESQRRAALRAAEGGAGRAVAAWIARLTDISAMVEAQLDYGDEGDVVAAIDFRGPLRQLRDEVATTLARPPVERLHDGMRIVIAGPRNAGKSSLINSLSERSVAITSPIAGTTRDLIETTVVRAGKVFVLIDTAGLTDASEDPIEQIGIARARDAIANADVILWLGDDAPPSGAIWLYPRAAIREPVAEKHRLAISTEWSESVDYLWARLDRMADETIVEDMQLFTRRERSWLVEVGRHLSIAIDEPDLVLLAEALRQARRAFRRTLGFEETDQVLSALFHRFCLGK